jgi:hypothetical protein
MMDFFSTSRDNAFLISENRNTLIKEDKMAYKFNNNKSRSFYAWMLKLTQPVFLAGIIA